MTKNQIVATLGIISLFFPLLAPRSVQAAAWAQVDSSTTSILFSVDKDSDQLIAVGENGDVTYSDDGGMNWSDGSSGTSDDLYGVSMLSITKAVAVGADGTVIRTTDGGDSWDDASTDMTSTERQYGLRGVYMVSTSVGWAVGEHGLLLKTTDGGVNWSTLDSPTSEALNSVDATSTSVVWIVGEQGKVYRSSNGGTSWTAQTTGTSNNFVGIYMYSSSVGYLFGDDEAVLKTTDGGTHWSDVDVDELQSGETVTDMSFRSADDGILAGSEGTMLETDDGGDSWSDVEINASEAILDVINASATEWWGVGDGGTIVRYDSSSPDAPSDFDVTGDNNNVTDTTPKFSWTAGSDDETSVEYYEFKMDSGSYKNVGSVTSKTYSTELDNGQHTAYVRSVDAAGNTSSAVSLSFTVDADSTSSVAPDMDRIGPTSALKNETVTFSALIEDDDGTIASCVLYVDGEAEKSMTVKTDVAYATMKFTSTGSHTMYARCTNDDGESGSGSSVTVKVISESSYAEPGDIVKIGCTGNVYVNDPCTAVYYYGYDGKRHAFSNESVFKSWFDDFDDLVTVTSSAMADISLGENVIYKPGEYLVQFSDATVYAVSYAGILRPIGNSSIAKAIFGSDWTDEIKGVNDVFYSNYRIGSTIESSADFSVSAVQSASKTIDSTF